MSVVIFLFFEINNFKDKIIKIIVIGRGGVSLAVTVWESPIIWAMTCFVCLMGILLFIFFVKQTFNKKRKKFSKERSS